jgi:DNA-binding NtrC family response regulator
VTAPSSPTAAAPASASDDALPLAEIEKRHILATLEKAGDNRTHAAKILGISVRTLRNKLSEYGLAAKED